MQLVILTASVILLCASTGFANPVLLSRSSSELKNEIAPDTSANCPPGYSQPANSNWNECYKIYTNSKSRKDASAQCNLDNGTLSSVQNAFVNSHLYSLASKAGATTLWLGIACYNGDKTMCQNDDGTPFKYDSFYQGQPSPIDMCVYMSTTGRDSQMWSTFICEQAFNFACEVAAGSSSGTLPITVPPPANATKLSNGCPTGYTAFQGMCYKIHYNPDSETHDEYATECALVPGGSLASIPNKEVDDFLQSLPSKCPFGFTFEIDLQCPKVKFSGDTSSCVWDDGTKFGYSNFVQGHPIPDGFAICPYVYNRKWVGGSNCVGSGNDCGACQAPMN